MEGPHALNTTPKAYVTGKQQWLDQTTLSRLAIQRDEGPVGALRDGLRSGQEALLKALGIEAGKPPTKGIVGRNAMRQSQEGLQPGALALAKEFHILEPFPTG